MADLDPHHLVRQAGRDRADAARPGDLMPPVRRRAARIRPVPRARYAGAVLAVVALLLVPPWRGRSTLDVRAGRHLAHRPPAQEAPRG